MPSSTRVPDEACTTVSVTAAAPATTSHALPVQAVLRHRAGLFARLSGMPVAVMAPYEGPVLPADRAVHLARAVDLALANVDRHSQAPKATVSTSQRSGRIFVRISDDGIGIDPVHAGNGTGFARIREHAVAAGARVWFEASGHGGTNVVFDLPAL